MVEEIEAPIKILRLTDDPLSFSHAPRSIEGLLKVGLPKCTHVIVTAKKLLSFLEEKFDCKSGIHMPNGVDLNHFRFDDSMEEPLDLKTIPQPRVIYTGSIDERLDLELIQKCAKNLPEVSFLFIGPQSIPLKRLEGISNIFLLGPLPYEKLPSYLNCCQAAMIPFVKNRRTDAICSIKLMQYLASGLPTIANSLEELVSQGAPIDLASSADEFSNLIKERLKVGGDPQTYRSYASMFSWEKNLDAIESLLSERLVPNG